MRSESTAMITTGRGAAALSSAASSSTSLRQGAHQAAQNSRIPGFGSALTCPDPSTSGGCADTGQASIDAAIAPRIVRFITLRFVSQDRPARKADAIDRCVHRDKVTAGGRPGCRSKFLPFCSLPLHPCPPASSLAQRHPLWPRTARRQRSTQRWRLMTQPDSRKPRGHSPFWKHVRRYDVLLKFTQPSCYAWAWR